MLFLLVLTKLSIFSYYYNHINRDIYWGWNSNSPNTFIYSH